MVRRHGREGAIHRLEIGRLPPDRVEVGFDGRVVAARDRAGELEAVVDRALHQRARALRAARRPLSQSRAAAR